MFGKMHSAMHHCMCTCVAIQANHCLLGLKQYLQVLQLHLIMAICACARHICCCLIELILLAAQARTCLGHSVYAYFLKSICKAA